MDTLGIGTKDLTCEILRELREPLWELELTSVFGGHGAVLSEYEKRNLAIVISLVSYRQHIFLAREQLSLRRYKYCQFICRSIRLDRTWVFRLR